MYYRRLSVPCLIHFALTFVQCNATYKEERLLLLLAIVNNNSFICRLRNVLIANCARRFFNPLVSFFLIREYVLIILNSKN